MSEVMGSSTASAASNSLPPNWKVPSQIDDAGSSEKKSFTMSVISKLKYPITHKDPAENPDRGNWNNRVEFVLSCMGFAIGLGNLWRFPYKLYDNGGGSFLVAYLLMLVLIAFPMFLLELALGQFSSSGPIKVFRNIMPMATGIGWLNLFQNLIATCNYTSIMAYAIFYLFSSFQSVMPWQTCEPINLVGSFCFGFLKIWSFGFGTFFITDAEVVSDSNSTFFKSIGIFSIKDGMNLDDPNKRYKKFHFTTDDQPISSDLAISLSHHNRTLAQQFSVKLKQFFSNESLSGPQVNNVKGLIKHTCELLGLNLTIDCIRSVVSEMDSRSKYASEEYFNNFISNKKTTFWNLQGLTWQMVLCYYTAWFITGMGLFQGPKLMGKIVYFTSIFPIVMILVFVIYGGTLSGKNAGYAFYLKTDWSKLREVRVWRVAAGQIFFSLSIGGGGLMTLASYNIFHNDFVVDAGIVAFANCFCSFISGFAVFAFLGHMAEELGRSVPEVVDQGTGLAFIAYSHATSTMPAGHMWAALWFLNLLILGIDSNFALMETFITWFCDAYPSTRNHKWIVVAVMSAIFSLLGLMNTSRGGLFFLSFMEEAAYDFLLVFIVFANIIMISYVYGAQRFIADIQMMLGMTTHGPNGRRIFGSLLFRKYSKWYTLISWYLISPVAIGLIMIFTIVNFATRGEQKFTETINVPLFGKLMFWGVAGASFPIFVVSCGLYVKHRRKYSWKQMIQPTKTWGPALNQFRTDPYKPIDGPSTSEQDIGIIDLIKGQFAKQGKTMSQKDRTEIPDREIFDKPLFDDVNTIEKQLKSVKKKSFKSDED